MRYSITVWLYTRPEIIKRATLFIFFLSVMPPSLDLAPFSYICPRKNPLSTIKYKLSTCYQQMGKKNWLTHEPRYAPPQKIPFINAIQPFYGCQRNVRKNITLTVSVRVSVTVKVSLVWFGSSNSLTASSVAIWWITAGRVHSQNAVNFHTAGRVKVDTAFWLYTRPPVCIASFLPLYYILLSPIS